MLEADITLPDNLVFYLSLSHILMIFNLNNQTVLPRIGHSGKGINSLLDRVRED